MSNGRVPSSIPLKSPHPHIEEDEIEEIYLNRQEYDLVMRLHQAYPIPALTHGLLRPVCTQDIQVHEKIKVADSELHNSNSTTIPKASLWDVGEVIELSPQISKITISVSELRNRIRDLNIQQ